MPKLLKRISSVLAIVALVFLAVITPACGVGGSSADGAGQGLLLMSFIQEGIDNAVLNTRLRFIFSEDVDPDTISSASIQIREGPDFGKDVKGLFLTQGNEIIFEPQLAGLCDQSDSGLKPDTQYRVQTIGFPEEFAIRNMSGQPLNETTTHEFHTRIDTDPNLYEDQIPGVGPEVIVSGVTPANGSQGVPVAAGNKIVLPITENLGACTVNDNSVLFHMYELGDPAVFAATGNGTSSGFAVGGDTSDQTSGDPFTWGATGTTTLSPPQKILASINLTQSFNGTTIEIVPDAGRFPENALIVVQLTFDIKDYGNIPMLPFTLAFTTENLPIQPGSYVVENAGETPWNVSGSTADINTARSPSLVQGFMLFAGDGDNGGNLLQPSLPEAGPSCLFDLQSNDGTKDDFDPSADVLFDTGNSINPCPNATDGSNAVVWEFNTMRIRNGFTVRVVGRNAAIFLVQGDVLIENGGILKARGTSAGDNGQGQTGGNYQGSNGQGINDRQGGKGVAGGGNGGVSEEADQNHRFGDDGNAGLGSADYDPAMPRLSPSNAGSPAAPIGAGSAGRASGAFTTSSPWDGSSAGGGGAGHSEAGQDGDANNTGTNYKLAPNLAVREFGGVAYERAGNSGGKMQKPEAGSGGGSAGFQNARTFNNSTSYVATGGAGGAGGGFIDVTSSGDISIFGTLDVGGGRGGDGAGWNQYNRSAGAGGGSGGGARLLTPNDIVLMSTSVVTAAGGAGGIGKAPQTNPSNQNDGGAGANGRIVMETSAGIVSGIGGATVVPGEGDDGFYRGPFDANRFQGGGLSPQAISDLFAVGPFNPMFAPPVQNYGVQEDFIAGTPVGTTLGTGKTAILIEARGSQIKPDGTPTDIPPGAVWFTIGHFTDSGVENLPTWNLGQPSVGPAGQLPAGLPADNGGSGINNLDTNEFIQLRVSIYLPSTVGPFDAGSFIDRWTIRFTSDQ